MRNYVFFFAASASLIPKRKDVGETVAIEVWNFQKISFQYCFLLLFLVFEFEEMNMMNKFGLNLFKFKVY